MLTASPSTQDHARDIARALSQPGIKIMAVRIVGEADAEDAISTVALRLLERARAGKLKPTKLAAYVNRAVQRECFDLYNRQRRAAIDIDDVVLEAAPERVETQVSIAYHKIDQCFAEQLRLTYHAEIATRDRSGGGTRES